MISIIIPVFNAEKMISKCLDSILNNNFHDYEIILINDGSSDDSWQILEDYRDKYPDKIKIYSQKNQGVAAARNNGMKYASSEYIIFIDNDDYVDADYFEKFLNEAETKKLDMVIGGYKRVTEQKTLYEVKLENTQWSKYMIMAPWAKIYRKEFLMKNKIEFLVNNIGEDVYFNLQAINLTSKISIIDYSGYNWFYNDKSVSNTSQKTLKNNLNVMHLLDSSYDKLKEIGVVDKEELEFYFVRYVIWYLLFTGRKSNYAEINSEFTKTFGWIKDKFPKFGENKNISPMRPQGESLKNRIAISVFMLLYKFNLLGFFLKIYSKN